MKLLANPTGLVLRWSVRSTFRDYVSGIPDGIEEISGGATLCRDNRFAFAHSPDAAADPDTVPFTGSVRFYGYNGALDVLIRDPWLHLMAEGAGSVSILRSGEQRQVIARFTQSSFLDDSMTVVAPRLVLAGVSLLGDVYDPGELLDPIEISRGQVL